MGAWNGGEAKRCSCGVVHDEASWAALPLVGHLELTDETDAEIRNCLVCHSSIAVEVVAVLPREAA